MSVFQKLSSLKKEESLAIQDLVEQNEFKETGFSVLFFSNQYDPKKIESELNNHYADNVIAVSTAGEISDGSYQEHSIAGFSINQEKCKTRSFLIENISDMNKSRLNLLSEFVASIVSQDRVKKGEERTVCLLFVDGISGSEEVLLEILADIVGDIPIVGGSNGDGLDFKRTSLVFNGTNYSNSAVLLFLTTDLPFEVIKTQHFDVSEKKLVITGSIPEKRIVTEINGFEAAYAYAELLGMDYRDLNASVFSENPLALNIDDKCYIRSIRNVNSDGSLTFYCAIENGIVLSVAKKRDIVDTTKQHLNLISNKMGGGDFCILFECVLRRLEVINLPEATKKKMFQVYSDANAIGFHTYGEQMDSLHVNQTLTGVLFGRPK